jgi:hypothetical protein
MNRVHDPICKIPRPRLASLNIETKRESGIYKTSKQNSIFSISDQWLPISNSRPWQRLQRVKPLATNDADERDRLSRISANCKDIVVVCAIALHIKIGRINRSLHTSPPARQRWNGRASTARTHEASDGVPLAASVPDAICHRSQGGFVRNSSSLPRSRTRKLSSTLGAGPARWHRIVPTRMPSLPRRGLHC